MLQSPKVAKVKNVLSAYLHVFLGDMRKVHPN